MKYKNEDIDLLMDQLKIEEVVGEFVDLKKSGANYKGLCPFHQDSNPSFIVSPSKNICKCFVCGAGGNPVKFYADYKKINFFESVKELAQKYKIKIKSIYSNEDNENDFYYKIMNEAHSYFCDQIFLNSGREALEYLSKRKISPQLIKENGIGFASNSWTGLHDHLLMKGYKLEDILELGLVKKNENNTYDTFRNRVIFPIYSPTGKIIAFGGRTLEDRKDIPKYINSPETPIFKKGKNLYGIKNKGTNLKKKNYSILMEGYMDVLSAHSYGFDVALAPLGTAFTEEQGVLLKRYTNNIILAFDMDVAGQMATEKTAFILKKLDFNLRVLVLEGAKDPDEYLKKYGKESFLKAVKNSLEIFDYLYMSYSKEYNLDEHISKQKFIERFKEFFRNLENNLEQTLYLDKLSKSLEVSIDILRDILINNNKTKQRKSLEYKEVREEFKDKRSYDLEELTIAVVIAREEFYEDFKDKKLKTPLGKKIFSYLEFSHENNSNYSSNLVKEIINTGNLNEDEERKIIEISMALLNDYSKNLEIERGVRDVFVSWFILELKEQLKERKNIMQHLKLKKVEEELKKETLTFEEIKALYNNFLELVNNGK